MRLICTLHRRRGHTQGPFASAVVNIGRPDSAAGVTAAFTDRLKGCRPSPSTLLSRPLTLCLHSPTIQQSANRGSHVTIPDSYCRHSLPTSHSPSRVVRAAWDNLRQFTTPLAACRTSHYRSPLKLQVPPALGTLTPSFTFISYTLSQRGMVVLPYKRTSFPLPYPCS